MLLKLGWTFKRRKRKTPGRMFGSYIVQNFGVKHQEWFTNWHFQQA